MDERPNPVETDRPTMAEGASEYLPSVVQRNRGGGKVGSYAVCSAHPALIDAAIQFETVWALLQPQYHEDETVNQRHGSCFENDTAPFSISSINLSKFRVHFLHVRSLE
jgi:hypothetical protein